MYADELEVMSISGSPMYSTVMKYATVTRTAFFVLLVLCLNPVLADEDIGRLPTDVSYTWGVQIPMRDGVHLNATLYGPPGMSDHQRSKLPAIVTITPYISDRYQPDAQYFARHGYAFLVVDTRGRGNSEGAFKPMREEDGLDGHDVIEWVASQPWSNGKVAMRGGSYGGFNQWATAMHFPPHLTTIVPIAAAFPGIDFPMNFNIPYPYTIQWSTLTSGRTGNGRTFGDSAFWNRKYRTYHENGLAFADLDELVGNTTTFFDEWLQHPTQDEHWAAAAPGNEDFDDFDLPILTITGYYDGDQPGAMEYYRRHMQLGSGKGKTEHYLLLGPWDHSGTRMPRQTFGGLTFGEAMMFDAFALDKAWYDWTMGDGERPAFLKDKVTYFVAGANKWKSAPSLEAIADGERVYHLSSNGFAGDIFHAGSLVEDGDAGAVTSAAFDSYVYDPLDTSKVKGDPADDYIIDQTEVVNTQGDGLIYHSPAFEEATEISGVIRLEAWIELDVPDTDINMTIYEVFADGSSISLTGEMQRARYRTSLERETLIKPGEINLYNFDRSYFISRQIAAGSRLRLFIRPGNSLNQQRNYNSGKPVSFETSADARVATVKLYHNEKYPSRLILPLVTAQ
jgi:putative CocE/NonD family hydrolase